VGHPYFDEVRRQRLDAAFLAAHHDDHRPLVTILPGSRTQEVTHNLKYFLKAALLVRAQVPAVRFAIASFRPHHAHLAQAAVDTSGVNAEVFLRRTPELIHLADCCMAVSGSVSLELLHHTKPTVVLYWVSPVAFAIQKWFRRVKYITLVNLLSAKELFPEDVSPYDPQALRADEVLFPEYLTCEDRSPQIAEHVISWLTDRLSRQQLVERLAGLKAQVAHGGACQTAAGYILDHLEGRSKRAPRPHFIPPQAPLPTSADMAHQAAA
jgi:lipid-A-disaccharide synthase